ncbi:MAG: leucine-rich repeat domain-containing protein [Acutalibacteraceae bacterium]|nr:leucine-rich repeat domain-containing protein [Acutalibacteraceae bacterium]
MSKKEKKKVKTQAEEPIVLDIPEDEIWTYQVEGLAAPHVNKPYKYYGLKKVIFALVIIVAVSLSMYFSVRTVQKETFEYEQTPSGYTLTKFSNNGFITTLDIDYVSTVVYAEEDDFELVETNDNVDFIIRKDETKKITAVGPYTLNCDEKVKVINIGADVDFVDPKAFYSCWALRQIEVDENNPNYCDIDGVLYSKDKKRIICRPCDHDAYLAEKYGFVDAEGNVIEPAPEDAKFEQYKKDVLTYVVPSSVEIIGELCFNYANMVDVYIPEGVKKIETLGFFEIPRLESIYSYKGENTDTHFTSDAVLGEVYLSLPEGLEYIGSDAFSYNMAMKYVYIPDSVTYIGHHAFWDTVYKEGNLIDDLLYLIGKKPNYADENLRSINRINVAASKEEFKEVDTGDSWRPQFDFMLFKKSVDVVYDAQRMEKQ